MVLFSDGTQQDKERELVVDVNVKAESVSSRDAVRREGNVLMSSALLSEVGHLHQF